MLRCHMKAEAMLSILITETYYSILTFNGVNRPRKIEKNHETSPGLRIISKSPKNLPGLRKLSKHASIGLKFGT